MLLSIVDLFIGKYAIPYTIPADNGTVKTCPAATNICIGNNTLNENTTKMGDKKITNLVAQVE